MSVNDSQYSADSAKSMTECQQQTIEKAGIPVRDTGCSQTFPAQEQAAKRSRAQMCAFHPGGDGDISLRSGERSNVEAVAKEMRLHPSKTDPDGSWTGVPQDPMETPVQDADDL